MAWSLEIHHLDIGQGDSTLIVARNDGVGMNQVVQTRALLVDGGLYSERNDVHNYITTAAPNGAGLAGVNVMVVTHYDADHAGGIRGLLGLNVAHYNNTIIYDQGEQGALDIKTDRNRNTIVNITGRGREGLYTRYLDAIVSRGARTRITARVAPEPHNRLPGGGWQPPNWLLGQEILWRDNTNTPRLPGFFLNPANLARNLNPPTVTVVAVNAYIQGAGGAPHFAGNAVDPKNEKSIALLVRFNNFKYYIGGDIESTQEAFLAGVLNPTNNLAGRVLAMKASHHGSDRSSTAAFINTLRPLATIISCGYNNAFGRDNVGNPIRLPRVSVLNNLENCLTLVHYYMTQDREQATFDARVGQIANNPMVPLGISFHAAGNIAAAYTAKAVVAGSWNEAPYFYPPPVPSPRFGNLSNQRRHGHIKLTVTNAQSNAAVGGAGPHFTISGHTANSAASGPFNTNF